MPAGDWGEEKMRTSLRRVGIGLGTLTATATLAVAGLAGAANASTGYHFRTLNNKSDLTFNQLLGINNDGVIAGYFGSGAQGHPNKGYELRTPNTYRSENFPHSVQTQVTGLNDEGVTVGFWSTMNTQSMSNNNFGFYYAHGSFHPVNFPTGDNASPQVDQLLGVNDHDIAVGSYTNGQGSKGRRVPAAQQRPLHHAGGTRRGHDPGLRRERQRRGRRRLHHRLRQQHPDPRLHVAARPRLPDRR
jgi:hypothetical protein